MTFKILAQLQNPRGFQAFKVYSRTVFSQPLIPFDGHMKRKMPRNHLKLKTSSEVIFGLHPVNLALQASRRELIQVFIKDLFWLTDRNIIRAKNSNLATLMDTVELKNVTKKIVDVKFLNDLCNDRPHQGVALECSPLPVPLVTDDLLSMIGRECLQTPTSPQILLFFDHVKDIMNFGNLLRTAVFFTATRIFLPASSSCYPIPIVSKISSGAMEVCQIYRVSDKMSCLQKLREQGFVVIGTSGDQTGTSIPVGNRSQISELIQGRPVVLIIGSEDQGISQLASEQCDFILRIPGELGCSPEIQISSLNVTVATGIILHSLYSAMIHTMH